MRLLFAIFRMTVILAIACAMAEAALSNQWDRATFFLGLMMANIWLMKD